MKGKDNNFRLQSLASEIQLMAPLNQRLMKMSESGPRPIQSSAAHSAAIVKFRPENADIIHSNFFFLKPLVNEADGFDR